jgi:hypothetical protein
MRFCHKTLKDLFCFAENTEPIEPTTLNGIKTAHNYDHITSSLVLVRWNGRELEALIFTPHQDKWELRKSIGSDTVLQEFFGLDDYDEAVYQFEIQRDQYTNFEPNRTNNIKGTPLEKAKLGYIRKVDDKYEVIVNSKRLCTLPIQSVQTLYEFYA